MQENNTHVYFQLNQKDSRFFKGTTKTYENSYLKLFVTSANFQSHVGDAAGFEGDVTVEAKLNKGSYIAFAEIDWSANRCDADTICFSAYSSSQIAIDSKVEIITDPDLSNL